MESSLRTYQVADFFFTVENLSFEPKNLQPFVAEPGCAQPIFSLRILPELPANKLGLLYKTPVNPGFPVIAVYTAESGYIFEYQPLPESPLACSMLVDSAFKNACLQLTGTADITGLNNALMLLYTFATAQLGALEMHSSVVMNGGKGYMFLGKSGTGKSTHSQLWIDNIPGTELLNDDNPIIRLLPDGSVRVYGSPWSGKTPCYKSKDVPVGAIVPLKQAPYNKITRLPVIQAYVTLMESASGFRPFKELADGWHRTMEGICAAIPFYRLECLPDRDAALLCYNTVNGTQSLA